MSAKKPPSFGTFEKSNQTLDKRHYPKVEGGSGFKVIKVDFEKASKDDKIDFREDGIYYTDEEGIKRKGYMFIKEAWYTFEGKKQKLPKFHLVECETIKDFIKNGRFKYRFEWSNSNVNDIIDKGDNHKKHPDQVLPLCTYCSKQIADSVPTTEAFFESLNETERQTTDIEVDLFGYTKDWEAISRKYKEGVNYTCETCQRQPKSDMDSRYWHTHHKDSDKLNNEASNLACLCIECHSKVDESHGDNFKGSASLVAFLKKYKPTP